MIILIVEYLRSLGISAGFMRLIDYPSFRFMMALATALAISLIFGFRVIVFLYRRRITDTSGDFLSIPASGKQGTPTGGGLMILASTATSLLLWADFCNPFLIALVLGTFAMGFVGFIDDYLKVRFKSSLYGLSRSMKTILQIAIISPFLWFFISSSSPIPENIRTAVFVPFYKTALFDAPVWLFSLYFIFAVYAICNAVNITDGKDGLSGGTSSIALVVFLIFAYVIGDFRLSGILLFPHIQGASEIAVFLGAFIGGIIGFLWYNTYPAEIFMGDTGSLAIGLAAGLVVFFLKQELLFPLVGGVFVLHNFTSLIQDFFIQKKGRRFFHRAPFHHELSHLGMAEPKVVVRIWIISFILGIIGLLSLKIR